MTEGMKNLGMVGPGFLLKIGVMALFIGLTILIISKFFPNAFNPSYGTSCIDEQKNILKGIEDKALTRYVQQETAYFEVKPCLEYVKINKNDRKYYFKVSGKEEIVSADIAGGVGFCFPDTGPEYKLTPGPYSVIIKPPNIEFPGC